MQEPKYHISVLNKDSKKKNVYRHTEENGDKILFTALKGTDSFWITKRELMLYLQIGETHDISIGSEKLLNA